MLQNPTLHHIKPPKKDISETDNGGCNHTLQSPKIEETESRNTNHCMRKEANRLKSFANWPCKFLKPEELAKAGFYYTNRGDCVRCPFCNVEVCQWEEGDDPLVDHARWSNSCSFLKKIPCGDVPIEEDSTSTMSQGYDTCGKYGIEIRPNSLPEDDSSSNQEGSKVINLSKFGIQSNLGPAYPHYALLEQRLASFADWPPSIKQTPKQLSEAGFFYNQKGDQTICFYCGCGLKDWVEADDPWEQHVRWFPKCGFARIQKGDEYISEVCNRLSAVLSKEEATALETYANTNDLNNKGSNNSCSSSGIQTELNIVENKVQPPSTNSSTEEKKVETTATSQVKELNSEDNNKIGTSNTLCKICYSKEVGVLFLPCRHFIACVDCAPALKTCAVCRKPLEAIVRVFLS